MTDQIDTSKEAVEKIIVRLDRRLMKVRSVGAITLMNDAIETTRALLTERDAEKERADRAERALAPMICPHDFRVNSDGDQLCARCGASDENDFPEMYRLHRELAGANRDLTDLRAQLSAAQQQSAIFMAERDMAQEELSAANDKLARAPVWRTDWENAPKDRTPMFLHWDWEPLTVVGYFGPTEGTIIEDPRHRWRLKYDSSDLEAGWSDPTHFMLITPPNAKESQP